MQERRHFRAPRLKDFAYQGSYAYFVTICTFNKNPYFKDKTTVESATKILRDSIQKNGFILYAYCFMLDHLHLLIAGRETSMLNRFVRDFKQMSAHHFKSTDGKTLWQRSYYDHVIRKEESLNEVALYILNNPVRKGLVHNFKEYEYSGSLVFDIKPMRT